MRHALTIAGSDSGAGAGIQADLKTFAAFGVYGTSAVTAVTAQNTAGIVTAVALSADLVTAQIETIVGDIRIDATKIGMLSNAAIVEAVVSAIEELELPSVVLDPVIASSRGERLLDEDGVQAVRVELLPRVQIVCPNIFEAEVLSGCRIGSRDDRRRAAKRIHEMSGAAVVITGGHANFTDDAGDVVDLLFDGTSCVELRTVRVSLDGAPAPHGTGCTFASALTAGLARGEPLASAAGRAQRYVAGAIAHRIAVGHGAAVLDHFWESRSG